MDYFLCISDIGMEDVQTFFHSMQEIKIKQGTSHDSPWLIFVPGSETAISMFTPLQGSPPKMLAGTVFSVKSEFLKGHQIQYESSKDIFVLENHDPKEFHDMLKVLQKPAEQLSYTSEQEFNTPGLPREDFVENCFNGHKTVDRWLESQKLQKLTVMQLQPNRDGTTVVCVYGNCVEFSKQCEFKLWFVATSIVRTVRAYLFSDSPPKTLLIKRSKYKDPFATLGAAAFYHIYGKEQLASGAELLPKVFSCIPGLLIEQQAGSSFQPPAIEVLRRLVNVGTRVKEICVYEKDTMSMKVYHLELCADLVAKAFPEFSVQKPFLDVGQILALYQMAFCEIQERLGKLEQLPNPATLPAVTTARRTLPSSQLFAESAPAYPHDTPPGRILCCCGAGATGKTMRLERVALEFSKRYPHCVYWIEASFQHNDLRDWLRKLCDSNARPEFVFIDNCDAETLAYIARVMEDYHGKTGVRMVLSTQIPHDRIPLLLSASGTSTVDFDRWQPAVYADWTTRTAQTVANVTAMRLLSSKSGILQEPESDFWGFVDTAFEQAFSRTRGGSQAVKLWKQYASKLAMFWDGECLHREQCALIMPAHVFEFMLPHLLACRLLRESRSYPDKDNRVTVIDGWYAMHPWARSYLLAHVPTRSDPAADYVVSLLASKVENPFAAPAPRAPLQVMRCLNTYAPSLHAQAAMRYTSE
eukprot:TRINITY_DN10672_c0_g1_i1.p1 TRINITY_DN10672_c0_g1~~TRINITY_DN10672_c0_g1_i1.p1  ORF type:complete len:698 (+),score=100.53 TRINITY_DN10672_c0_g1_i1:70-2163(+)